jgi:hypothetical protein
MMATRILARLHCWIERCRFDIFRFAVDETIKACVTQSTGLAKVLGSAPGARRGKEIEIRKRALAPCSLLRGRCGPPLT